MAKLTDTSIENLQAELSEKREALRVFRFGGAGSRSRNVREGRNLRKDIARILTELNGRVAKKAKKA
jgi:ribosomal protein L29